MNILPHQTNLIAAKWHVIYTHPRGEKKVHELLNKAEIESFLPLHKVLRQWSDRKKWVELPLFPSYVFVKIEPRQYFEVLNTNKVVKYIYFEGKPANVRDDVIEAIKQLTSNNIEMDTTIDDIKPGDKVKIAGGPFIGFEAEMVDYRGNKKVLLRVDQLGQSLIINIPVNYIVVLGK